MITSTRFRGVLAAALPLAPVAPAVAVPPLRLRSFTMQPPLCFPFRPSRLLVALLALTCALIVPGSAWAAPAARQPNILLILTDDLGYSDIGCYGSEIATPTLDRLAAGGVRFTQFYNTAKCHSSRVSLMSGRYCRQAGDTGLQRAVTIPEVLAPAGYFTAMAGKWHLDKQPTDFGFQRYFGHLSGATNYYTGDNTFRLNGAPWTVPAQGFYTTVANVDHGLRFIGEARQAKKPWFLYLAFNAPHAPLQPLEADYKRYLGKYETGWDVVNAARAAKQRKLGLFGRDVTTSPRPAHVAAWSSLSAEFRGWESRRMAAYAALIDRVDQELGRIVADLERAGELENTLILFFSDNGACPLRSPLGRPRSGALPLRHDLERQHRLGLGAKYALPFLQAEPVRGRRLHARDHALARWTETAEGILRAPARAPHRRAADTGGARRRHRARDLAWPRAHAARGHFARAGAGRSPAGETPSHPPAVRQ